jgi:hypothetical protein
MASIVVTGDTSGSITLSAPAVAGSNTLTLPANTGTIITTASGSQSIPKAALPTGSVLQVVNVAYSTAASRSSNVYADTGLSASITPTSATSKILVMVSHNGCRKDSNNTNLQVILLRGSTQISGIDGAGGFTNSTATNDFGGISISYLDSPATTSSTTYKTQFRSEGNNATVYVNNVNGSGSTNSTMTLMEIAA